MRQTLAEDPHLLHVTGLVLSAAPVKEYDKMVVILTRERGKIRAFANGARRPNNALISGTRPFCFGEFWLYEGRSSFTIHQLSISHYFEEVTQDVEGVYLGYYFLELADYYTRENGDEFTTLKLLYQALRAIANPNLPNELVRAAYELRLMAMNGDYDDRYFRKLSGSAAYACSFIIDTPVERLFTFSLTKEVLSEVKSAVRENKHRFLTRELKSEQVLESVSGLFS